MHGTQRWRWPCWWGCSVCVCVVYVCTCTFLCTYTLVPAAAYGGAWHISLLLMVAGKYKLVAGGTMAQSRSAVCTEVMTFGNSRSFPLTVWMLEFCLLLCVCGGGQWWLWSLASMLNGVCTFTLHPVLWEEGLQVGGIGCATGKSFPTTSPLKAANECRFRCHKC